MVSRCVGGCGKKNGKHLELAVKRSVVGWVNVKQRKLIETFLFIIGPSYKEERNLEKKRCRGGILEQKLRSAMPLWGGQLITEKDCAINIEQWGSKLCCGVRPIQASANYGQEVFGPWARRDCEGLRCCKGGSTPLGGSKMIPHLCSRCMPFCNMLTVCVVPILVMRKVTG